MEIFSKKARTLRDILLMYWIVSVTWITAVILELIHANTYKTHGAVLLLDQNQTALSRPPGDSE